MAHKCIFYKLLFLNYLLLPEGNCNIFQINDFVTTALDKENLLIKRM